jgi:hypothetical protein
MERGRARNGRTWSVARFLFIVSRALPRVYDNLRDRFAAEPGVQVILDRRTAARPEPEGGRPDQRRNTSPTEQLRVMGYAFVRLDS